MWHKFIDLHSLYNKESLSKSKTFSFILLYINEIVKKKKIDCAAFQVLPPGQIQGL